MKEPTITYDVNSHIFKTYAKKGEFDPFIDTIIYDGGNLEELINKSIFEEEEIE